MMDESDLKLKFKLIKTCPECNRQFPIDSEYSCCPVDDSMLAPVVPPSSTHINDRYRLLSLINAGAWGEVYLAEQPELNRKVAIKVMHLSMLSSPTRVQRFQLEAKAVSSLKHPSICSIHDFGLSDDGRPYIVMEHVDGKNIEELLEKGPLDPKYVCKLLIEVADALASAHKQGMVHRDIKPTNIMITAGNSDAEARLLDFGLAKVIGADADTPGLTNTGEVLGTPRYMSPEQCRGQQLDGRSDIYSLGLVLYEMLTAKVANDRDSMFECMNWHLTGAVPPLPTGKNMSGLQTVLNRMVAKDRTARYDSATELKKDLQSVLSGTPLSAPASASRKQLRKVALATAVAAAVIGVGAMTLFYSLNKQAAPPPAIKQTAAIPAGTITPEAEQVETIDVNDPIDSSPAGYFSVREFARQEKVIQAAIDKLKSQGDANAASAMQEKLDSYSKLLRGPFVVPQSREPKLMIMAVNHGDAVSEKEDQDVPQLERAEANITYTGSPLILALDSYDPVMWKLHIAPKVQLKKIIVSGYKLCQLDKHGIPAGVEIVNQSGVRGRSKLSPLTYRYRAATEVEAQPVSKLAYSMNFTTITGTYQPGGTTEKLEVGPGSLDWRAQYALRLMQPLYDKAMAMKYEEILPQVKTASFWSVDGGSIFGTQPSPVKYFVGLRPVSDAGLKNGEPLMQAVDATDDKAFYAITGSDLKRFRKDSGREDVELSKQSQDLSWIDGITYDTKRARLLVSAQAPDNSGDALYSYTPASQEWKLLRVFREAKVRHGLTYDASTDKLYALLAGHASDSNEVSRLAELTPDGKQIRIIKLSLPAVISLDWEEGGDLLYIQDNLAYVRAARIHSHETKDRPGTPEQLFIYDLNNGELLWKGPLQK